MQGCEALLGSRVVAEIRSGVRRVNENPRGRKGLWRVLSRRGGEAQAMEAVSLEVFITDGGRRGGG